MQGKTATAASLTVSLPNIGNLTKCFIFIASCVTMVYGRQGLLISPTPSDDERKMAMV